MDQPALVTTSVLPPVTPPSHLHTILTIFIVTVSTFTIGLTGTVGYYKYFNDSVPLPPTTTTGMLLGVSDSPTETPLATPSATPIPNLALSPESVDKPLPGTLAYLQNNQVYTIKADRKDPLQLTSDTSTKSHLTISPDGLKLAYAFKSPVPELAKDKTGMGLALINRQSKEIKTLVEPDKAEYSALMFSPSGKYLAVWINQGIESIVIDLESVKIISRYGTPLDGGGVSPITWIPGTDRATFILKNELFVADADGKNIKSLALDVLGVKPQSENQALPLTPIWSKDGKNVAFHRATGLVILNPELKQEIPVLTVPKAVDPDKITWRAHAFTETASHLIYEDYLASNNQTTQTYSLVEKKNVALSDISDTLLFNSSINSLLGFPPKTSHESTLELYSFSTWKLTSCPANDFRFNRPEVFPAFGLPPALSPDGNGLAGFTKASGSLNTVRLINLTDCSSYDLVKADNITDVLWLPN